MAHAASKAERIATSRQREQRKAKIKSFDAWRREQAAREYKQSIEQQRVIELEHSDDWAWQEMVVARAAEERNSWL